MTHELNRSAVSAQDALDDLGERPLVVVIIGDQGAERVWLSDKIETEAQHEWAAERITATAVIARQMLAGSGRA